MGSRYQANNAITLGTVGLMVLAVLGCSTGQKIPTAGVSGTITVNGKPLKGLEVFFVPVAKIRPAFAICDERGHYNAQFLERQMGVPLGPVVVQLAFFKDAARATNLLPAEYNEKAVDNPALHLTVPKEGTTFNFDVKTDKPLP